MKEPFFEKRSKILRNIPEFWGNVVGRTVTGGGNENFELENNPVLASLRDVSLLDNLDAFGSHEFHFRFEKFEDFDDFLVSKFVDCENRVVKTDCSCVGLSAFDLISGSFSNTKNNDNSISGTNILNAASSGSGGGVMDIDDNNGDNKNNSNSNTNQNTSKVEKLKKGLIIQLSQRTPDAVFLQWLFGECYDPDDLGAAFRQCVWQNPYVVVQDLYPTN